jgi:hypothetical protein
MRAASVVRRQIVAMARCLVLQLPCSVVGDFSTTKKAGT